MERGLVRLGPHRVGRTVAAKAVLAILGAFALLAVSGVPSVFASAPRPATIVGQVLGINDDPGSPMDGPLRGATVTVVEARSGEVLAIGLSDELGRYEITVRAPASVKVHITRDGFLGVWSDNQQKAATANVYRMLPGRATEIVHEQVLWAEAVISGRVLQTFDPPTDPVRVKVFNADTRRLLGSVDVPRGEGYYQIGGLPAGPIKVVATPLAGLWADSWADGAASWKTATVFTLHAGQHLTQSWTPTMILYLDMVYAGEVRGTVVGRNGRPIQGSAVTVFDTAGQVLAKGRTDAAGVYALRFQDWGGVQVKVRAAKDGWNTVYANGKTSLETADVIMVDGHSSVTLAPLVLSRGSSVLKAPRPVAAVDVLPTARLGQGGLLISATVRTRCEPNGTLWEGFINATQGDLEVLVGLPLTCDGRTHVADVEIPNNDPGAGETFTRGQATVRAVILDENTLTPFATDTQQVKVR